MPNHVTNRVEAPPTVLASMINPEGRIDFNMLLPFSGEWRWNGILGDAETAAEVATAAPLHDHPLVAALQESTHSSIDVTKLSEESFEQFVQMLRNKRACGFLHCMDFARTVWGTKWNAYDQVVEPQEGWLKFDTAWSCPIPVLEALSKLHPEAEIRVQFADEDIGSNCGMLIIKGGQVAARDEAGRWDQMSPSEQQKWEAFAYQVKGWSPSDDE
jgi:hypothetical protein